MVDQSGEKTGMLVKVNSPDTSILLISGMPLKNRPVKQLQSFPAIILPGEKKDFKYNDSAYRIYATGQTKVIDSASKNYEVTAYKLFIETTLNHHHYIQLLVDIPSFEGPLHTAIKFVGDIDNDGIPDFIIDTSNYYGSDNSTLFLSQPSKGNVSYTIVGETTGTA
ncbi:MAG: hypothetical protein AAGC65_11785 [Mucilaginibacter sp.]|uniref:hypothetical protein n=1 Tax=Mucilaginibacter sp. TaxID=1882438 RepID=UPI0031ADDE59